MKVRMRMNHLGAVEHGWNHFTAPDCWPAYDDVFLAMVLCQSGLTAKALSATLNAALVGPLASVNSTVAGQRTAVAESLLAIGLLAHVWAFTGMGSLMNSQGRALDERLCAAGFLAHKRSRQVIRNERFSQSLLFMMVLIDGTFLFSILIDITFHWCGCDHGEPDLNVVRTPCHSYPRYNGRVSSHDDGPQCG